jgi:hypothetical protein
MVQIVNVKLKNGNDILGILNTDEDKFVIVENPIQIEADPQNGFYAKSWLLLSDENNVTLDKKDIFYVHSASEKSIGYYENFIERISFQKQEDDFTTELEDIFNAIMEAKDNTRH